MKGTDTRGLAATAWSLALLTVLTTTIAPVEAQTGISAEGLIESTAGGLKFPDGTVQTTSAGAGSAPIADTGLEQCFDATGSPRDCRGTGEDGEFQAGLSPATPRFTDNGDGTVTDNLTRLIWLKDANCPGISMLWQTALDWVASLNTTTIACADYTAMTHTDWRLPNIKELLSLADYGRANPALSAGHPFQNVEAFPAPRAVYWSSSSPLAFATAAYSVFMDFGGSATDDKDTISNFVWPVRGGR